jgi:hypothetical protein
MSAVILNTTEHINLIPQHNLLGIGHMYISNEFYSKKKNLSPVIWTHSHLFALFPCHYLHVHGLASNLQCKYLESVLGIKDNET